MGKQQQNDLYDDTFSTNTDSTASSMSITQAEGGGQTINSSTPSTNINKTQVNNELEQRRCFNYQWSEGPDETEVPKVIYVKKVTEMMNCIRGQRIDMIYKDKELFILYMNLIVKNVVFKRKWSANCMTQKYHEFVTFSDEAFVGFLVLENDAARYFDMASDSVEKENYACPKYTDVIFKGERRTSSTKLDNDNLLSRGWTDEGKFRFMQLFDEVEIFQEKNKERVELLANYLIDTELATRRKRTRKKQCKENEVEMEESIIQNDIETSWKQFMQKTSQKNKNTRDASHPIVAGYPGMGWDGIFT